MTTKHFLGNQLTDMCAYSLIEGLKNNSSLTSLDLSANSFGERAGSILGGALVSFVHCELYYNNLNNIVLAGQKLLQ